MAIRFGIIGVGNIGSAHAKALFNRQVEGAELAAVCDISPDRRRWATETLPGVAVFDTDDAFFAANAVDAVIIATPHYYHPPLAVEAFAHHLHVLTEKPAGVAVSQVQQMIHAAEAAGTRFGIMWNQRTSPLYARVRELVQGGALGEPQRLLWQATDWYRTQAYYDSGSWRATWGGEGGGVLMNQAPHQLDLMQWIFGMPNTVTAFCREGAFHRIEVEDDATLICRYESGAEAIFITSTGENPGTNRLEISGTRGKLVAVPGRLELWLADESGRINHTVESDFPPESGHVGILNNFAAAIRTGAPLLAEGADGLPECQLSNAAYLSSWTGQAVTLPIDTDRFDSLLAERCATSRFSDRAAVTPGGTGEYAARWSIGFAGESHA